MNVQITPELLFWVSGRRSGTLWSPITDNQGPADRIVEAREASPAEQAVKLCNSGVMAVDGTILFSLLKALKTIMRRRILFNGNYSPGATAGSDPCSIVETEGRAPWY